MRIKGAGPGKTRHKVITGAETTGAKATRQVENFCLPIAIAQAPLAIDDGRRLGLAGDGGRVPRI